MGIQKLPLLLINQIAAGEVIERPASVVKELVENSLDAGATRVDITIEDGGRRLIRVSDNGSGIVSEELLLAVAPHATSKLTTPQQLSMIATLGFRGEAIASIASVSRLRITSRAMVDGTPTEAAGMIEVAGEEVTGPIPVAAGPGTIVEVRDLFFNTPARRKFLRAASTEFGHISEMITRTAMGHPDTGFKLVHGSRTVIDLPPGHSRRRRCIELIGKELDEVLLQFEGNDQFAPAGTGAGVDPDVMSSQDEKRPGDRSGSGGIPGEIQGSATGGGIRIWGLAGMPSIARSTSKAQYICVNSRPIRDRTLSHAIKEAYRGLLAPDRQPVAVLFLDISPDLVDVNVHPSKSEVRFRDANRLHGMVLTAIRQRLLGSDLTPSATTMGSVPTLSPRPPQLDPPRDESEPPEIHVGTDPPDTPGPSDTPAPPDIHEPRTDLVDINVHSPDAFVDYFKRMDPKQKGFVYNQVKQAMGRDAFEDNHVDEGDPVFSEFHTRTGSIPNAPSSSVFATETSVPPPLIPRVLQVHKSYLVTEDSDGVLIVDQHALHERVMFEQLRQRITHGNLEGQRLLTPGVVKATPTRIALLDSLGPLFKRIGVDIEQMGPEAIAIHAFPSFLFERKVEPESFINEMLDLAEDGQLVPDSGGKGQDLEETVLHRVIDMMACKAAVKAGDQMTPQELDSLLAQREQIERSASCPHGRPTSYRIILKQLAKEFKRT